MRIIYCDAVFDHKTIEPDYQAELNAVLNEAFDYSLISFEALLENDIKGALKFVKPSESEEIGIYRGWMLTPKLYADLYHGLLDKGIRLINTPASYQHCHYLPNSYHIIESKTPKSEWTNTLDDASILKMAKSFDTNAIIVKDYVKSEKHHWNEACFIPDASDENNVKKITSTFIELRGDSLNEGLVFRKFEELEFLTKHSKSDMPLTKEFRIFFLNKKVVQVFNYWDEGDYGDLQPNLDEFISIANNVESNFFTMDIAQKKNGEWIIMELGDGQVAGLPDNANKNEFYKSLVKILNAS
ncbi:ATP-grasp domain-containing protein [uncultured Tenacibaculum sp.]|uniref:ATP-grasp domain-containing protein n=1 Tax=uncultured Tenacibaculum sp. TaxID=174713 RepID=UPI002612A7B1|nr:ATP-grasp domain-containing protein [uncultured Tenacibaculum sp.]